MGASRTNRSLCRPPPLAAPRGRLRHRILHPGACEGGEMLQNRHCILHAGAHAGGRAQRLGRGRVLQGIMMPLSPPPLLLLPPQVYELSSPPGVCTAGSNSTPPLLNCSLGSADLVPLLQARLTGRQAAACCHTDAPRLPTTPVRRPLPPPCRRATRSCATRCPSLRASCSRSKTLGRPAPATSSTSCGARRQRCA